MRWHGSGSLPITVKRVPEYDPCRPISLVLVVAGLLTYLATPITLRFSRKIGAVDVPNDRKVHAVPTPTLGGTAMFVGFLGAMLFASSHRSLSRLLPAGAGMAGLRADRDHHRDR